MHFGDDVALENALRSAPFAAHRGGPVVLRPGQRDPQPALRQRDLHQGRPGRAGDRVRAPLAGRDRSAPVAAGVRLQSHDRRRPRRTRRRRPARSSPCAPAPRSSPPRSKRCPTAPGRQITLDRRGALHQAPGPRTGRHRPRLPDAATPDRRARPRSRAPHPDPHQRPRQPAEADRRPLRQTDARSSNASPNRSAASTSTRSAPPSRSTSTSTPPSPSGPPPPTTTYANTSPATTHAPPTRSGDASSAPRYATPCANALICSPGRWFGSEWRKATWKVSRGCAATAWKHPKCSSRPG